MRQSVAIALVALLVSLSAGGAALHFCLDGIEPPVTVHFENLSGHVDHDTDSSHNDFERQALSDNVLPKVFGLDLAKILLTCLFLILPRVNHDQPIVYLSLDKPTAPAAFLPPLRAPPRSSV